MNQVIIINGPSCAGKTTIAKEICKQTNYQFVPVQIDEAKKYLFTILDSKATPRKIARPICDEILLQTAQIFLNNGKNIVIDTTFDFDERDELITTVKHYIAFFNTAEVVFVGINAPAEERLRRFKENNSNPVRNEATIIAQSNVFDSCKEFYDICFDSSLLNGEEIAGSILQHNKMLNKTQFPQFVVRTSELTDTLAMVSLSKAKRLAYEKAQPQFWRYSGEEGDNTQRQWFKKLLADEKYLMFTAESNTKEILGFIIGKLMPAPEVYNPGGLTLMIDDFCVNCENLWQSVGHKLIEAIKAPAQSKSVAQILVVCGAHDHAKRKFLSEQNLSIASEWFVGGIV